MDYRVERGKDARSELFKAVNNYVADIFWENKLGYKDPLVPSISLVKEDNKGKKRKKEKSINFRSLLYRLLVSYNQGPQSDRMANAYCYFIKNATLTGIKLNETYYLEEFIKLHKRFTPTLQMLVFKGKLPDVKIGRYKTLFLHSEWNIVSGSSLFKAEELQKEVGRLGNSPATYLSEFIAKQDKLKESIEADLLSAEIKRVRQERLFLATKFKENSRSGAPLDMAREVFKNIHEPKVSSAFNPLRIPFAAGRIKTTPGEGITLLRYEESTDSYYVVESDASEAMDDGRVKAYLLEYAAWLNSGVRLVGGGGRL
jgi:hypothetical protein